MNPGEYVYFKGKNVASVSTTLWKEFTTYNVLIFVIHFIVLKVNNKMKRKKYHTVGTTPKSNLQILKRGKIDMANTHIDDRALSWVGTDIDSAKKAG